MDILIGIILGLIVLTILVVIHELGHAIVARRNGVTVEEFGIGFPPRAWGRRVPKSVLGKNVTFSLNWLPLGGFVKLQGENDSASNKGDYGAASFWVKTKILLAGVLMNWITAVVLITILALVGMPKILPDQFYVKNDAVVNSQPVEVTFVENDSAASRAGLEQGDKLIRFGGEHVSSSEDLSNKTKEYRGKEVDIIYARSGVEYQTTAKLRGSDGDSKGYLGVASAQRETVRSSWSAPIVGIAVTAQFTAATLQGLGDMVANAVSGFFMQFSSDSAVKDEANEKLQAAGNSVAGPVGIFGMIFPAASKAGPVQMIMLAAIISLSLAVMNALPIPALDGGRWFVTALFRLLKKPLSKDLEEKIHGYGFMALILLIIAITVLDVTKITR